MRICETCQITYGENATVVTNNTTAMYYDATRIMPFYTSTYSNAQCPICLLKSRIAALELNHNVLLAELEQVKKLKKDIDALHTVFGEKNEAV